MINKSFQLLRTNPALTTNIKLVVSSDNLYLESFDTNKQLSDLKYKHFLINKDNLFEDQVIHFYDGLASQLAFAVKYDSDVTNVFSSYDKQYDDIYWSGAKSVEDDWYSENQEYFAPLYIRKGDLPDGFIILRVDNPMSYNEVSNKFGPGELNKDNFYNQIVDKWKCVNFFDMRYESSDLGSFLNNNYIDNSRFPEKSLEIDFRNYEYSKFYGIDYLNGVYVAKSKFLQDILYYEQPHFKLEKEILNGFKDNNLIFPHILNLKFLFDDIPATPEKINNYSLNRYYGFYIDNLELVTNLTSYVTPKLKKDYTLINNIFVDDDGVEINESPFVEGYTSTKTYWIQYEDEFYNVNKNDEGNFQIISDFNMSGLTFSDVNNRTCFITYEDGETYKCKTLHNPSGYTNHISGYTEDFIIDPYYEDNELKSMYADLYLINIDGNYHVLKNYNGEYFIQSDYAIQSNPDNLIYWKCGKNSEYYTSVDIYSSKDKPVSYPVYRLKFSDVKDFDFDRVDTKFADFDYQKDKYHTTTDPKLYGIDYVNKTQLSRNFKIHPRNESGQYKIMNISSEYVADDELYEISFNNLTEIWRKNQSVVKWGYTGSNSNCDYPYKLNNSKDIGDVYNRTCNINESAAIEIEKNLDYFYRVGNFFSGSTNNIQRFLNQTTNIEVDLMGDFSKKFNLDLYLNSDVDYFDYFFKNKMYYEIDSLKYIKQTNKFSTFQGGDIYTDTSTLFKGLNIKLVGIDSISRNVSGEIINIIENDEKYNNYKFSILLNDVYDYYNCANHVNFTENAIENNYVFDKSTNGIHIFLNDKYKNLLIIINIRIPLQIGHININNLAIFNERSALYDAKTKTGELLNYSYFVCEDYGFAGVGACNLTGLLELENGDYDPSLITASNFINAISDLNDISEFDSGITYYYVNDDGLSGSTGPINVYNTNTSMKDVTGKNNPPFIIKLNDPELLKTKKESYIKTGLKGPSTNIYDKYQSYYDNEQKQIYSVIEPLARKMDLNIEENNLNTIYASNSVSESNQIYRYNGTYEPIMKDISLFNNTYLYYSGETGSVLRQWDANYKFDTTYTNFGIIDELIFSKVNPIESPLKLKNIENDDSIYPMVDEYGYQFGSKFIFQSNWNSDFYVLTNSIQNINKRTFSNLSNKEYIIHPLKPKNNDII